MTITLTNTKGKVKTIKIPSLVAGAISGVALGGMIVGLQTIFSKNKNVRFSNNDGSYIRITPNNDGTYYVRNDGYIIEKANASEIYKLLKGIM